MKSKLHLKMKEILSLKRGISGLLSACKSRPPELMLHVCRCSTSSWRWKMFSLDDELTVEVKQSIEKKWKDKVYGISCAAVAMKSNTTTDRFNKKYILSMFPYPSGRLHLGHVRVYTLGDVLARYFRMTGNTVVHPMGWDAFGLPAENAARDSGVDAEKWTRENIQFMKNQIIKMGCSYDWEREFATCDYSYYRWTQWLFIQLFEKGLAYRKEAYVYWDPVDKTVLAEEQVDSEMKSWRSGAQVERKLLRQWFIRTAAFAKDLTLGLESGELKDGWRDIVQLQKHWIGTMKGNFTDCVVVMDDSVDQKYQNASENIRLWFSNVEALSKSNFCIISPDHYLAESKNLTLKTFSNGIKLMKFSIVNPATGSRIPVFSGSKSIIPRVPESADCRTDEILNEEEYSELCSNENFIQEINDIHKKISPTSPSTQVTVPLKFVYYPASLKLRDWLVSRQRKWGTPIPAMNCNSCGHSKIIPFEELEEKIPVDRKPQCPKCGSDMDLETDTLDTFFDSSWYFYRFLDSNNNTAIFDQNKIAPFLPVDVYIGGKEHATLHLYYARFMSHFLHQLNLTRVKEPFKKLIPVGIVMGETFISEAGRYFKTEEVVEKEGTLCTSFNNEKVIKKWEKMSKSKHNGIDPQLVINEHGIDTTRLLMMAEMVPVSPRKWPSDSLQGFLAWQTRLWSIMRDFTQAKDFGEELLVDDEEWRVSEGRNFDARNFYLKGVIHCFENTSQISIAISKLQGMMGDIKKTPKEYMKASVQFERALGCLIICLYPIMPAFGAQLWQEFRAVADQSEADFDLNKEVWEQEWPVVDMDYKLNLVCKVVGKEMAIVKVERQILDTLDVNVALELAFEEPKVSKSVPRELGEVISFQVNPGFGAILNIRRRRKDSTVTKAEENSAANNISS